MTPQRANTTVPMLCEDLWKEASKHTCWAAEHGCLDSTITSQPAAGLGQSSEEQPPAVGLQPQGRVLCPWQGSSATWSAEPPLPQSLSASGECGLMLRNPTLLLPPPAPPVERRITPLCNLNWVLPAVNGKLGKCCCKWNALSRHMPASLEAQVCVELLHWKPQAD